MGFFYVSTVTISSKTDVSQASHLEERMLYPGEQHRMANTLRYLSVLEWETVEEVLTRGSYRHTDDRKITEEFYEHMLVLMCEDEISILLPSTKNNAADRKD